METEKKGFEKPEVTEEQEKYLDELAKGMGFDCVVCAPSAISAFIPFIVPSASVPALVTQLERVYGKDSLTVIKVDKEE